MSCCYRFHQHLEQTPRPTHTKNLPWTRINSHSMAQGGMYFTRSIGCGRLLQLGGVAVPKDRRILLALRPRSNSFNVIIFLQHFFMIRPSKHAIEYSCESMSFSDPWESASWKNRSLLWMDFHYIVSLLSSWSPMLYAPPLGGLLLALPTTTFLCFFKLFSPCLNHFGILINTLRGTLLCPLFCWRVLCLDIPLQFQALLSCQRNTGGANDVAHEGTAEILENFFGSIFAPSQWNCW